MFEYITNPWISALIVMSTQFIFLYLRTKNISYVAEKRIFLSVSTGTLLSITWLISVAFSVNAISLLEWQPILGFTVGGALGTYYAMKIKIIK